MSHVIGALRVVLSALVAVFCIASLYAIVSNPLPVWTMVVVVACLIVAVWGAALLIRHPNGYFFEPLLVLLPGLVAGRLLSTTWLIPAGQPAPKVDGLMLGETGPGIPFIEPLTLVLGAAVALYMLAQAQRTISGGSGDASFRAADWIATLLRAYVGLMFISHFTGHVFAGPIPFDVFVDYFGKIGMPFPSASVVLAGLIEITVCIGLAFGLMTRPIAVLGTVYLLFAVGIGGHFSIGYSWALPGLGVEFPVFWAFAVALFGIFGAGPISLDARLGLNTSPQALMARARASNQNGEVG
ncbi:DoxX family protein [Sphingomonas sp. MMS24-J13]|uniref:DoxX family protein n=1 Tax=Sphingomonas sp. MMS24-J13 TaxID=3238686 RepID=UPI003850F5AD